MFDPEESQQDIEVGDADENVVVTETTEETYLDKMKGDCYCRLNDEDHPFEYGEGKSTCERRFVLAVPKIFTSSSKIMTSQI